MKSTLCLLMALVCNVAWAAVLPTEPIKASQNLPTMGIPEYQFYVRGTKSDGQYWNLSTVNTNNVNSAGKFAFYAVPGLADCYYIYSVDAKKWVNYNKTNRNNQKSFVEVADNFDANAYWKITMATKKSDNTSCYQMQPTVYTTNQGDVLNIKTDRYANWFQGADNSSTLGLWEQSPSADEGSAWSLVAVDVAEDLNAQLARRIALANKVIALEATYTKQGLLTSANVTDIISSPYTSTDEGSIANLVDGSAGKDNHWHSDYSAGGKINGSHYIVANLGEQTPENLSFMYKRRNGVANDHTTRWAVYGVPADETGVLQDSRNGLTLLAVISTPLTNANDVFENLPPFKTKGFKKFRIYADATNQNRGYFHIGEFQLYGNTLADGNTDDVKALVAALTTAEGVVNATQGDIDALNEKLSVFLASEEDIEAAREALACEGVGYPTANNAQRLALQELLNGAEVIKLALDAAVTAYKETTDIILPEDGNAYTFTNYSRYASQPLRYLNYTSGSALSMKTEAEAASVFVCRKLRDGVYVFVTEDGKYMTWMGSADGYQTSGTCYGYSNVYPAVQGDKTDWNEITIAQHTANGVDNYSGTNADFFGMLHMTGRRKTNQLSSFIVKGSNGGWDCSNTTKYFQNSGNYCSSAWYITGVEHTNTPAQDLALAKIDAKIHVTANADKLGNGIGCAYYMVSGEKKYTAADVNAAIDNATTIDVVNAIKNSYAMTLPEFGKAYTMTLVANNNDKTRYKIIATDGTLEAKTEGESSVFYCLQSSSADYPYIFVSEDGYVMGYKSLVQTYVSTDNRHNFMVGAMVDKTSNITSSKADRLGMVYLTTAARNPNDGTGGIGCLTIADSNGGWSNSDAPYHNGAHTSAIVMTEQDINTLTDAQVAKADEILGRTALKEQVEGLRAQLKKQPGYYYCTINEVKMYDADAILAAINAAYSAAAVAEISTAITNKTLIVPEVGKYYRIKGKTSGNYIDAVNCYSGDQMGMKSENERDNLGSIFLLDEGKRLLNVGTGTYVKGTRHIGADKNGANTWTFTLSSTGCFNLTAAGGGSGNSTQLHDNGNRADRCSSICTNGTHNFIIEEVPSYTLNIDAPAPAGATATWNGETKALPATWTICEGMTITNTELTLNYENVNYTFGGLFEGEQQVELPLEIATLEANRNLTAKLSPAFFSKSTKAEDLVPVQIYNYRDKGYTICLNNANDYTGHAVNSGTTEYSLDEIWYLVGDAESFKMYSHTAGMDLALTLAGTGSGSAATMTATGTELSLIVSGNTYNITPKGTPGQSFNMHGGKGNDIKLYSSSDAGSTWGINVMDINHSLTYSVTVSGTPWDDRYGVAELTFNVNGISSNTHVEGSVAAKTCYLPKNATFTLSSIPYRGYTFSIPGGAESYEGTLAEGNLTIDLAYTANEEKILYHTPDANGKPYRIPAIAAAPNGHIFAIADNRPCGNDIGYGEVDIKCRISTDNGTTWGDEFFIANGLGELPFLSEEDRNKTGEELNAAKATVNNMHIGFGDAAVVADRESNKLLVMMVAGRTVCHNGRWDKTKIGDTTALAVNRVARVYAEYDENAGEWKWTHPEEVTDHMYSIFLNGETPTVTSMFIGSGKICQSRVVKKDQYYRLYCSIWTRDGGNRVIYSDDFGGTWNVLGTINDRPASGGDEPKVEELADGTVVLSSRKYHGRYFNLFKFNDDTYTTGSWGNVAASNEVAGGLSFGGNSTNGEIYKVKAIHKGSGRVCDVMLQSIPTGSGRDNVAIFYKELDATTTYTPTTIAQGWTKGKHVSYKSSCYSTMIMQADGRIAFLFEEAPGGYCIVYIPYTIEDITGGAYTSIGAPTTGYYRFINRDTSRKEYLYNDATLLGNTLRFTLQTDDAMTTNNGIWRITKNAEDKLGVMNGDGNPIVAGNNGGSGIMGTYSELTIHTYKDGYYYFTEALNCSNGNNFMVNGTPFLTKWSDGGSGAHDNQWRLEPVSIEGKTIYEVVVSGDANAYVTYDNGTTVQNAFNGGFFITDGAITGAQLSAGILNNEFKNEPTITIEGTTITLSGVKPLIVKQDLYNTSKIDPNNLTPPYRIPGITTAYNGRLITAAARLVCGTDPGYGQVDVVCRYSDDHGDTWSKMIDVAVGDESLCTAEKNVFEIAFGDPAIVADRTSSEVLIIAVAGCTVYADGNTTRQNPNMIATIHSTNNGEKWGTPVNVTDQIYSLFDNGNPIQSAFVGGGKIFQSRIVKKGDYYRLYAAMCARPNGNRVIYSDDFGRTWHALGGASALPAPGGDEPKCEEMPDGRVILSSRVGGGRIYNIYTYSNTLTAEGSWGTSVKSTFEGSGKIPGGNSTNGEILIVPVKRNSDQKEMYLALQSLPTGGGRSNVGIFYKELTDMTDINTVANFTTDWNGFFEVTTKSSAYSSMDLQADDRIGFIYEETLTGFGKVPNPVSTNFPNGEGTHNYDGFDNIYVAYPLEYITNGAYSIKRDVDRREFLRSYFTALADETIDELKAAVADDLATLSEEPTTAETDKLNFYGNKILAIPAFDAHMGGKIGHYTDVAVTAYKAAVVAAETVEELTAAKNAVLTSDNWNKPVSGKAYTFKNVQKDGTKYWFKYNSSTGVIETTTTEADATAFVCRLLENGKYVFVCNDGKYMICRGSYSTGIKDNYDVTADAYTDITIEKMTTGNNIDGDLSTTCYVTVWGRRSSTDEGCVVVKADGSFNATGYKYNRPGDRSNAPFYKTIDSGTFSSAIIMEEAPFGNAPQVNSVGESGLVSDDLKNAHMSTFSATYATVAPEGVTAYYATKEGDNVVLNAIAQGKAIPDSTGVILVSEEGGNAVMLPAAGETAADVAGNLLVGSAGADKNMDGIANAYILTDGAQGAGFYRCSGGTLAANKAYLVLPQQAGANAPSVRIRLAGTQGGTPTEVEMPIANGQQPTAVYDLQGRRVLNPTKGMYIVNGKKMVIK